MSWRAHCAAICQLSHNLSPDPFWRPNIMTRNKTLLTVMVSAMAFSATSCGSTPSSPTPTPTPTSTPISLVPPPATGTSVQDHPVTLPGMSSPFVAWISNLSLAKGGTWSATTNPTIKWKCSGPADYMMFVSVKFVAVGEPDPPTSGPLARAGGMGPYIAEICNLNVAYGLGPEFAGKDIAKVRFYFWLWPSSKGALFPDWVADGIIDEPLDWKWAK